MSIFRMIWLAAIVIAVGTQIVMLSLQVSALRRYGHRSFWFLGVGTFCVVVYAIIYAVPFFVTLGKNALATLLVVGIAFALIGVIFGVWGTASLFRRFGELHRASIVVNGDAA